MHRMDAMTKLALAAMVFSVLLADGSARAQELDNPTPGQLLNKDYLTSTGETVPRPGGSQASGPSPRHRSQEERELSTAHGIDDLIEGRICDNCGD